MMLVTGSSGFIGTGVRNSLAATQTPARLLVRTVDAETSEPSWLVPFRGDLTDARTVDAAVEGASTIIHAASYIGNDPEMQRRVNVEGTRRLVEAAVRHGAPHVLYVSTFGVYGGAYEPGAREDDVVPRPRSSLSVTRLEAEHIVLANGGSVVRPALVYGEGDRWVLGPLVTLTRSLGAWVEGGRQLVSAIDRDTLGSLVLALAGRAPGGLVFHAALPDPIQMRHLVGALMTRLGLEVPLQSMGLVNATARLRNMGLDPSKIAMITKDTWISADRIWAATGLEAPSPPMQGFTTAAIARYATQISL